MGIFNPFGSGSSSTSTGNAIWITNAPYSADATGVAECSAAINSAAAAALAAGVPLYGAGTFKVANTITLGDIDVDLSGATFRWTKAFPLGSETPCILVKKTSGAVNRRSIRLPRVIQTTRAASSAYWSANGASNDIGIQVSGANACQFTVPFITDFSIGLAVDGDQGRGTVYNTFILGELVNNRINFRAKELDQSGWSNSNVYLGGSFSHFEDENTERQSGTRHFYLPANPTGGSAGDVPNSNVFIGASLETKVAEYYIEAHGPNNVWDLCRWEIQNALGPIRCLWTDSSYCHSNKTVRGLGPSFSAIQHTQTSGACGNGGEVLAATVATQEATTSATATDLATVGPTVSFYAAIGDIIDLMIVCDVQGDGTNNARGYYYDSLEGTQQVLQRSTASFATLIAAPGSSTGATSGTTKPVYSWIGYPVTVAGVHTISLKYGTTSTGTATFKNRTLMARINRVSN